MGDFGGYGGFEHMPSGGYGQMGQMGQMGRMSRWNGKVFSVRDAPIKKTGIMWEFFQNSGEGSPKSHLYFLTVFLQVNMPQMDKKTGKLGENSHMGGGMGLIPICSRFFVFVF